MKKVVWRGRFEGMGATTVSTNTYPLAANLAGIPCKVNPIGRIYTNDMLNKLLATQEDLDESYIILQSKHPEIDNGVHGHFLNFDFTWLDQETIDAVWKDSKVIMVHTEFQKKILEEIGLSNIHVVNFPITPNFCVDGKKLEWMDVEPQMIFGSVFKWDMVKRPQLMWKAFIEEFPLKEYPNVYFINRITIPEGFVNWKDLYSRYTTDDPRIYNMPQMIPEISNFYRALDCYCAPCATEGFNATLLEAMACGTPVIGSRDGGNLDFMNDENSFLVEVGEWEKILKSQIVGWKLPLVSSIREQMRKVYTLKIKGNLKKNRKAAKEISKRYQITKISSQLQQALSSLL